METDRSVPVSDYVVSTNHGTTTQTAQRGRFRRRGNPDAISPKGKQGATLMAASSGQKSESADLESGIGSDQPTLVMPTNTKL